FGAKNLPRFHGSLDFIGSGHQRSKTDRKSKDDGLSRTTVIGTRLALEMQSLFVSTPRRVREGFPWPDSIHQSRCQTKDSDKECTRCKRNCTAIDRLRTKNKGKKEQERSKRRCVVQETWFQRNQT
ncbi:hypothetical protein K0M31_002187, partial [Melipona bicolor]